MALSSIAISSASYVTMTTWMPCPSSSMDPITETSTIDITTCPKCTMTSTMGPGGPTHTTVFVTSYDYICSTGWTNTAATVTETCTGSTPSWPMSSSGYVPAGYTTTTTVCTVCNESKSPVTATVTVPCTNTPAATAATSPTGAPAAASSDPAETAVSVRSDGQPVATAIGTAAPSSDETGTPVSIRSDGQPVATTLASAAPSGASGAPAASGAASSPVTSAAPAPAPAQGGAGSGDDMDTTTTVLCPGPKCMKTSAGNVPSGSIGGASSTPEAYAGGAVAVGVRNWQVKLLSGVAGLCQIMGNEDEKHMKQLTKHVQEFQGHSFDMEVFSRD
ncbi:hypothetical protein K490DRAFT_59777 [Saccharata proteae CBS 121410]|uniref:Uncharacterized protein n=1 Tax=Saccharata proteae CBS 121410 TaxID=1314787 RepID=A0A9P4LWN5_9PEZI|nr:hypothetical protein K490DRAFT_59777 [Saccharata proteae CBS 121410]